METARTTNNNLDIGLTDQQGARKVWTWASLRAGVGGGWFMSGQQPWVSGPGLRSQPLSSLVITAQLTSPLSARHSPAQSWCNMQSLSWRSQSLSTLKVRNFLSTNVGWWVWVSCQCCHVVNAFLLNHQSVYENILTWHHCQVIIETPCLIKFENNTRSRVLSSDIMNVCWSHDT